jgi:hypothetical protein
MAATTQDKLKHLKWAIESRAKNQTCALRLLTLFQKYESTWKTKKYSRAAQDLIAVSFSLWRAAFLAEKKGKRSIVFEHGRDFLEKVIEDNAISYPTDKSSLEWTFNYYTRNARSSLQQLAKFWKDAAPEYEGKKRNPAERWDYCQSLLDQIVSNFETVLAKQEDQRANAGAVRIARHEKRRKRKKVRQLTIAARSQT